MPFAFAWTEARRWTRGAGAVVALAALGIAGCSGEPERGPVTGVVTLDGVPLPGVVVMFVPDPDHGTPGPRSAATTDEDGRYVIRTDKDQDGASVGLHRVSLFDPRSLPLTEGVLPPPSRVPAAFADVRKTPLQPVTIGRDAQTYDIELKSK